MATHKQAKKAKPKKEYNPADYPVPGRGKHGKGIPPKSMIRVEPIRYIRQINAIREHLENKPRDLCLFVLGINNGLRCVDLLRLKVGQVRELPVNGLLRIRESKTDKENVLMVNEASHKVLHNYLASAGLNDGLSDDSFLFASQRTGKALKSIVVGRMVRSWVSAIGLDAERYGAHTLRKTWAYFMRTQFKVDWMLICNRLNHSSPAITQRYLGITSGEIATLLQNVVG
jgi:integrase